MRSKPKKRMKYPPGARLTNPVQWVLENISPVNTAEHGQWLVHLNLRNHSAIGALMEGNGTKPILRDVVAMFNMSRSLLLMGFGVDQTDIILTAEKGIREYTERIQKTGSYTLKASEITMLKDLLELHDAQMEVVTVGDVQKAIDNAKREFQGGKCTRLSTKYIGEPA